MAQHASVNRERVVAHLKTVLHALGERGLRGPFTRFFQFFVFSCRRKEILRHVAALAQRRFELLQRQKQFAVVTPWVLLRFNVGRPDLPLYWPAKRSAPARLCV